ncbi:hypothetical protein [Tunicatimonas pelagia]|uniref:hypothetical protein n=1 Tax=Tunicatimonas pelagia TaxID=931531 RepID=UPI0026664175|nr:hypothetical protein [Tunicatimonas pelagia]WKN45643.1 hypothetical protein P0M28_11810 [Tunicatimonas pelagia]
MNDTHQASNQEQVLRQMIEQDYASLWTKTAKNPLDMAQATEVYLTTKELVVIDPDLGMADPGAPSRAVSYETIFPLWSRMWEFVEEGGITSVFNINIHLYSEQAFAAFDATGEMKFKNGEQVSLFRNVTQWWVYTSAGWRIRYEHVSEGKPAGEGQVKTSPENVV